MTEVKTAGLIVICFSLIHGVLGAVNCSSPTPESLFDALEKELPPRKRYRPVKSFSDTMNVSIEITVLGILGVNEKEQSLTTFIWQVMEWDIEGLQWDEKECGTKRVSVYRDDLWVPDLHISEFMDENRSPASPFVYLYNTGHVYDDRPVRVISTCRLLIYNFPFDIQNCSLTFGSYLHFAEDIMVFERITVAQILAESNSVMHTRGEWELIDIKSASNTLEVTEGSLSELKYFVILRRKPILYVVNLLIPSCFLLTLDLFSFLLPPHGVDRSAFKMTLILGYTVFLLIMNDLLPVTGESTPLINVLFSISLALMVGSLLETVLITNIQHSSNQYGAVPRWLSVLVLQYLAIVVCLPRRETNRITVSLQPAATDIAMNPIVPSRDVHIDPDDMSSVAPPLEPALDELKKLSRDLTVIRFQIEKHLQGSKSSNDWQMIAIVIDRLLFGLYITFICVCFITIVCLWVCSNTFSGC